MNNTNGTQTDEQMNNLHEEQNWKLNREHLLLIMGIEGAEETLHDGMRLERDTLMSLSATINHFTYLAPEEEDFATEFLDQFLFMDEYLGTLDSPDEIDLKRYIQMSNELQVLKNIYFEKVNVILKRLSKV